MHLPPKPTLLSLLAVVLSSTHSANATPYPRELLNALEPRQCANPCGWDDLYCCKETEYCYTTMGQATCGEIATAGSGAGSWEYFTTTFVETDLVTVVTTFSSFVPATVTVVAAPATTSAFVAICTDVAEASCGPICCASDQFCMRLGQCAPAAASTPGAVTVTVPFVTSPTGSAFIRPTSNTVVTVTSTGTATTTVAFQTAVATDGSTVPDTLVPTNHGLSGGAIAGIVIGVLVALFILFVICLCCCAKGILDGLLSLFGLGKKKRVEETQIYESHHSHHGGAAAAPPARRWFGMRPARADGPPPKKSSGLGGMLGVAGVLAAIAVLLGLRRRDKKRDEKSDYDSRSSVSYSYYTSESSESSDRRTRDSRRTRDTRHSRR